MKYKIGDRVKVRQDLEVGKHYGGLYFVSSMEKYKIVTIEEIDYDGDYLVLENVFCYHDEMLDGLDNFKQEDIKSGMLVETREGTKKLVVDTTRGLILKSEEGYMTLSDYKDFKLYIERPKYDIVKVGETTGYGTNISNMDFDRVLWEEPIKIELTDDEKVILRNLDDDRYKYILRNEYGGLKVSEYHRGNGYVFNLNAYNHLFKSITHESGIHEIKELLEC